jgi:flagellar biosynthesis protein FlhB
MENKNNEEKKHYRFTAEPGKFKCKTGCSSGKLKRSEESNNFFIIIYGFLLTFFISIISILDIYFIYKFIIFIFLPFIVFYCFTLNKVRNFLIKLKTNINNFTESYPSKNQGMELIITITLLVLVLVIIYIMKSFIYSGSFICTPVKLICF